jgi:four helix bundle protein
VRDFRDVDVWKKSHLLALDAYEITRPFPREEQFGITSQIRRAASSVPANIAEGCGTDTDLEFARFLIMAMRSATETEYHLLLAKDLGYIDEKQYRAIERKVIEVKRMLASFIRKLRPKRPLADAKS